MKDVYIFDLDGTLIDSLDAWKDIGNRYLKSIGVQGRETLDQEMEHMAIEEACVYIKKEFHLSQSINEILSDVKEMIYDSYAHDMRLKEGVYDFLKQSYKQGKRMCVLTANDQSLAKVVLKHCQVLSYFECIESCGSIGYSKTNPQCYLEMAKRMNVSKEECVVFEDAYHALLSANHAGFYSVAVINNENQKDRDNIKNIANQTIESFLDIKNISLK